MLVRGEVIKLDRGLPTVKLEDGRTLLCEHATTLIKAEDDAKKRARDAQDKAARAVIGDSVDVLVPDGHDVGIIQAIVPRRTQFVRKDPTERVLPQVLAANFDQVIIVQPVGELNTRRLERELVLAFETGAQVAVVLTKADLVETAQGDGSADTLRPLTPYGRKRPLREDVNGRYARAPRVISIMHDVQQLAGPEVPVLVMSADDEASVERVRQLLAPGTTTVLMGRSGVGKSTLVNILCGAEVQKTADVRESDGKGRHTTVNRQIISLPNGARVIDMPGVRGLGLWEADSGIDTAFADIEALAEGCRFRDCKHTGEPGCAVRAAVDAGELSQQRYDSYIGLRQEAAKTAQRREQKHWRNKR